MLPSPIPSPCADGSGVGKRAGKGLWLIQVVRDILLDTEQTIVTNFAVKLPDLNAWLQKNHPDRSTDLHERIRFLDLDEIKRFYLIRGAGREIQGVTKEQERQNIFPDYEPCKQWPPVCLQTSIQRQ